MKARAQRLLTDQRLIDVAHWTSFSLGATSLAIAIGGTAWTAFFA